MNTWTAMFLACVAMANAAPLSAQERASRSGDGREARTERETTNWHLYFSSGLNYARRDDGDGPRTDYYRIPLSARLSNGRFRVSATMPYLIVRGPGNVDDDVGGFPTVVDRETRRGIGDLSLAARYRLSKQTLAGFELDLMGRVKVPTASRRKGLGTGEMDFAVGAELSKDMGKFEPFVSGQYRINGDPPDRNYRNTVATSVGSNFRISRETRASLAYDYSQSRIRGRAGSHMLDAGLSTRLTRELTLSGDAAVGLSKNAPDFRVGTTMSVRAF